MTDFLRDHPRMRGEYVFDLFEFSAIMGSPPHARGILYAEDVEEVAPRITPACAGNTNTRKEGVKSNRDHPRMRGEYPAYRRPSWTAAGSPPHARGIQAGVLAHDYGCGITPACAGNTRRPSRHRRPTRDHPRMRGEYVTTLCP